MTTYEKVFEVADNLLAAGKRPTQQMVRNELGTGSLTTINKALNDWWQGLGVRLLESSKRPDIPEPVFDSANALWQQALAYAEHQLSDQRQQLEQRYLDLKEKLDDRNSTDREDLRHLQDLSDRLLTENQRGLEKISELQQKQLAQEEKEMRLETENRDYRRKVKEYEITLKQLEQGGSVNLQQELLEYQHKNQYLEGESSRIEKYAQNLLEENKHLKETLFDIERQAMKEKHQLEQVIGQQDVRYRELEQQLNVDRADPLIEARLSEKDREIERLHNLLKSFNLNT